MMQILALRLSSLGDILLLAPVFTCLKKAYPDCRTVLLVKPQYREVAQALAGVDEVILYQGFLKTLGMLRQRVWDVVLDLHTIGRTRSLVAFLSAPTKVVYDKEIAARYGLVWLGRRLKTRHVIDRYREAFVKAGFSLPDWSPGQGELFQSQVAGRAKQALRQLGLELGGDLIGMAPGAKWATKRWPAARYTELGRRLLSRHPSARLLLTGSDAERVLCQEIATDLAEAFTGRIFNLSGELDLVALIGLAKFCRLFVANDSGLLHMAWLQGVPTVGIFGPTVRDFGFAPFGPAARIVERTDLACRPCSLHGGDSCPRGHFLCMELLRPETVLRASQEVWNT